MANEFYPAAHEYIPIFKELGIEIYKSAGTPTASGPAKGALVIDITNAKLYQNTGTASSATWNAVGDVAASEITLAEGSILQGNASGVATALAAGTSGQILVGDGTDLASVAVSGDVTLASSGAVTIATGAVEDSMIEGLASGEFIIGVDGTAANNAKVTMSGEGTLGNDGTFTVANTDGTAGLAAPIKSALVVYDWSVDGGTAGTIALTGAPTIPDNAVVWVDSYDVLTTCTSSSDAATIALQLPTDGVLTTAIAISDASNPWDAGVQISTTGGLATPLPKKTTAARVPSLLVAGGENLTAGKIVFHLSYWVSQ